MTKRSFQFIFRKGAAIVCGCFFLAACENDLQQINELTVKKEMVEEAKQISTYFSQSGSLRAHLTAPLMLRYQTDSVIVEFPKKLHVNFYDSTGKIESQLDALYGKYFETVNKVYLRDSVIVFNVQGDTLRCPELWWDQNTQKFFTDSVVRIHKKGDRIYGGKGMEAHQDLSDIFIRQPTGTVTMQEL
ncbi:MAG TPA: LPS export ABC transporter periplasmic protein LptC [Chitinophagaceae bacterium]|nr:LPS export ABC transporter periplasmic protein LptC [Chitinophagaceae bacterium]